VLASIMLAACPWVAALDPSLDADQYAHTAWRVGEGFSRGAIFSIAQTQDGYLWVGTEFGLLRFDGVKAVPWHPPAGQQLPSDFIQRLLVSRDGRFWIGTRKGLASWKDNRLTQYPELAGQSVVRLLEDHEGTLWIGVESIPGHGRLCAIQNRSIHCEDEGGAFGNAVLGLLEDRKSNLWVATQTGLWRWKPGPPKFHPMPQDELTGGLVEGENGALLVSTRSGVKQFVAGKMKSYPLPGSIRSFVADEMLRDRDGGLWIGTVGRGLVHVHQGRVDTLSQSDGLSGDIAEWLFQDREGNIWAATWEGLDRFRDSAVATFSKKQGLSDTFVGSVLADRDGSVWIATYEVGLDRWKNGQIASYGNQDPRLQMPRSLFQDSRGRIWVSTLREFGYLQNDRLVPIHRIVGGNVQGITEDTDGNLWIANPNALFRLSPRTELERIPWSRLGHEDCAWALAADPLQGGIWLGFAKGGITYFQNGQVRASYAGVDGLGAGQVNRFLFDSNGTVWVATDGGLSRLKNGRIATLTSTNGLPCNVVHWVIEDNNHSFWLYMPCGLTRIARSELDAWGGDVDKATGSGRTLQAAVFGASDGVKMLQDLRSYTPKVAKTSDGKLWFSPRNGVSVIDPRHIPFNNLVPPVHVEQIIADGRTYEATADAYPSLRLPAHIRELEIGYTALSFVAPEKVLFRYKLEGFDRDWNDVGDRRKAFYMGLPPGNYRFRVTACNNNGVWNEAGTLLDFSVARAYYQTTWFRLLCGAALLTLLWGVYRLRMQQLELQFQVRMHERIAERERIARDLHDTFFQGIQGLLLRFHTAASQLRKDEPVRQIFEDTLKQSDQVMLEGRELVWDLRATVSQPAYLPTALANFAEEMSRGGSCTFRVVVNGSVRPLHPVVFEELLKIGKEAVSNAFRHSRAHSIEAELNYERRGLRVRIRDDGAGIDSAILRRGYRDGHFGLPGIRERAKKVGAYLDVWSRAGAGTEVELRIAARVAYVDSNGSWLWKLRRSCPGATHEDRLNEKRNASP